MRKCPKCGKFMAFNMKYNVGQPVIEYICDCGYCTSDESYITDNKTIMRDATTKERLSIQKSIEKTSKQTNVSFWDYCQAEYSKISPCNSYIHYEGCGYFDFFDANLTEEERFVEHCVGCCCGDGYTCNKAEGNSCLNWEDGSEPILG